MSNKWVSEILINWYKENKRELPWRETNDPYLIWISEIILQQTRVAQGLAYYQRFVSRFPDIRSLAEAENDEVMKYWQGLGYYSRARNLHEAARDLMVRFEGKFPRNYDEICSLKGIGKYTAAAIGSFAWRLPYAVVDGNVYRVLARIFDIALPIDSTEGKKYFAALAQELLDEQRPDLYNQAIMDFGAIQCTPQAPDCLFCPFRDRCLALAHNNVDKLPLKQGKTVVIPRYFNYLVIHCKGKTLISQRTKKDIWQNLYEYPLIETEYDTDFTDLQQSEAYLCLMSDIDEICILSSTIMPKHVLSHRFIFSRFYEIEVSNFSQAMQKFKIIDKKDIHQYAVPRLIEQYQDRIH